jgi:hypothetical protein
MDKAGRRVDPLAAAGLYYVASGIWPLVHLRSFMAITGPKRDTWLVHTMGALLAAIGATMLRPGSGGERRATERFAIASAVTLAGADAWFVARRRISPIYLADAAVEVGLAIAIARRRSVTGLRNGRRRPGVSR